MLKIERTNLFIKWHNKIKDKNLIIAIERKIDQIETDGFLGKTSPVGDGVSEMKFQMGAGYRIYFNLYIKGNEVWLLSGGDKSTQQQDIDAAKELLKEIQQRRGVDNEQI
jgi:putative addiction module killer protein